MSKKSFKDLGKTAASQFISTANKSENINQTHETHKTHDAHQTHETHKNAKGKEYYRFNLKMPITYKEYLDESAYQSRKTITQYINDLIKSDMDQRVE